MLRLDFRDPEPRVIDISPKGGVVATLQESKIECLGSEKVAPHTRVAPLIYAGPRMRIYIIFCCDIRGARSCFYLRLMELDVSRHYWSCWICGRTRCIRSWSSANASRTSTGIFRHYFGLVTLTKWGRFKASSNAVLLATDIAARGLDIPAVDHVVHYQVPRSADVFIHRSGRTARAMRSGFSLLMCSPEERRVVRALLGHLGRRRCLVNRRSSLNALCRGRGYTRDGR